MKDPRKLACCCNRNGDKQEERKALTLWGYELWVGHGQRLGVSTQAILRRKDVKPRWKWNLGSTAFINLCEGIIPGVCIPEVSQMYLRSLGSSKFEWLYLGTVPISLLLDLHLLLSYCCLHPTPTTQRRENSIVSQFRGFTSHGQDSVVYVTPWQARERERGMSVFFSSLPQTVPANETVLHTCMAGLPHRHIWGSSWIIPYMFLQTVKLTIKLSITKVL